MARLSNDCPPTSALQLRRPCPCPLRWDDHWSAAPRCEDSGEDLIGREQGRRQPRQDPGARRTRVKDTIKVKGRTFKDLKANGTRNLYEDWRLPAEDRRANVVSLMTLNEKAGLMLTDILNRRERR